MTHFTLPKLVPVYRRSFVFAYAIVDDEDFLRVSQRSWSMTRNGYAIAWDGQKQSVYMHHLIAGKSDGVLVDHINGQRLDNRRANLRGCTPSQNAFNARRIGGKSGFRGVHWHQRGKWRAIIKSAEFGEFVLGYYDAPEIAAEVYDDAAAQLHGQFAILNFPDRTPSDVVNWAQELRRRREKLGSNYPHKLTAETAERLRKERAQGFSIQELMDKYAVSRNTVYKVLRRAVYK